MKELTRATPLLSCPSKNAPLSRLPALRRRRRKITRAQCKNGIRIIAVSGSSDANVVSRIQQCIKLFKVIDDSVIASPNEMRLLFLPLLVTGGGNAVIGMVER